MAKQKDFDLEGQASEEIDLRPIALHGEQPLTDIGSNSDLHGTADAERPIEEGATQHLEGFPSSTYGTPNYYQHLVKLAMTGSQLDNHALSFDLLHRLVLLDHEKKLAEHFRKVVDNETVTDAKILEISETLHEYTKATADYMFWKDKTQILSDTQLHNASSQDQNFTTEIFKEPSGLYKMLNPELKEIQASNARIPNGILHRWFGSEADQRQQILSKLQDRVQSDTVQVLNHFAMAFVGGISLIVPMLIMALHRSRVTSLVTTSVAVVLFAIVLAVWPLISRYFPWMKGRANLADADEVLGNKDVLLITAAYAAVLVVFVGASLQTVQ